MLGPPPYTLATPVFPFRALATLTGNAPMGGARESALVVLVAARLVQAAAPPALLPPALRAKRAEAARLWLTSMALPVPVRSAIAKLIDTTTGDDPRAMGAALAKVTDVTAPYLDRRARSELDLLEERLRDG